MMMTAAVLAAALAATSAGTAHATEPPQAAHAHGEIKLAASGGHLCLTAVGPDSSSEVMWRPCKKERNQQWLLTRDKQNGFILLLDWADKNLSIGPVRDRLLHAGVQSAVTPVTYHQVSVSANQWRIEIGLGEDDGFCLGVPDEAFSAVWSRCGADGFHQVLILPPFVVN